MLKAENRLKNNYAFLATYKQCQIFGSKFFTIYLGRPKIRNTEIGSKEYPIKIGFVVSNKIHKRASKRNRLKRLMRESFRIIIKDKGLGELDNFQSMVVVAKSNALELSFNEADSQIKFLLSGLTKKFAKHIE